VSQPRVFISYQRSDSDFANRVRQHLVAAGVNTWMDQHDIPVGAYWPDEIDKGLTASDMVVGILSPEAMTSRNVKNEWDWAIANGKRLVLLQVAAGAVPHRYISLNFIDATDVDPARALSALLTALGLDGQSRPATQVATPTGGETSAQRPQRLRRSGASLPRPLLVGRDAEQALLRRTLTELRDGHGALVLLGGEAGVGKTSLTAWLRAEAEESGALTLAGGCYDLTTTPPYGPWSELFRAWPADPQLPRVPEALRGGDAIARVHSQAALFDLVADLLTATARVQPLLVLLEDVHWADEATLDLLRYVARLVAERRILLVVTWRDDETPREHPLTNLLPALAREPQASMLLLQRLDGPALSALLAARYNLGAPDHRRLANYLERTTEGNPFFAEEVLQTLEAAGALTRVEGAWHVSDLDRAHVPELVRKVVEGRLGRLGDDARRLLEVAALIGHEFDVDLWLQVSGADEDALADVLERAIEMRLVEELPDPARLRFAHALVREALVMRLVVLRRRPWHRRIADALLVSATPDPDAVAYHLEQANDSRLADWLVRAGERAQRLWAWSIAIADYERAQALLAAQPERAMDGAWLSFRIGLLTRFTDAARSIANLDEAWQVGRLHGDDVLALLALAHLGLVHCYGGEIGRGVDEMLAGLLAIERLDEAGQVALRRVRAANGPALGVQGRGTVALWMPAIGRVHEARTLLEGSTASDDVTSPDFHRAAGMIAAHLGNAERARAAFQRAGALYQALGDRASAADDYFHEWLYVLLPFGADQVAERQRLMRTAASLWTASAEYGGQAWAVLGIEATELALSGEWTMAVELFDRALEPDGPWIVPFESERLRIARHRGDAEAGWEAIRRALPDGPATTLGAQAQGIYYDAQLLAVELALDADDLPLARAWLEAHDRWLSMSHAVPGRAQNRLLWSCYFRRSGDAALALEQAEHAVADATNPRQPLALIAAHRTLGALFTERAQLDAAQSQLSQSLALSDACAVPFERALTLLALAELRLAQANHGAARTLLAETRAICEPLGARPTLARIALLEREL
jgi:tetratricopeptide (TPR) repeat protein